MNMSFIHINIPENVVLSKSGIDLFFETLVRNVVEKSIHLHIYFFSIECDISSRFKKYSEISITYFESCI